MRKKGLTAVVFVAGILILLSLQILFACFAVVFALKATGYLYIAKHQLIWTEFFQVLFLGAIICFISIYVASLIIKFLAEKSQNRKMFLTQCILPIEQNNKVIQFLRLECISLCFGTLFIDNIVSTLYSNKIWWDDAQWVRDCNTMLIVAAIFLLFAAFRFTKMIEVKK